MSGTKLGGKKCAATNKRKYGKDFYARIGAMGGKNGHTGGFADNRELARVAGAKGGRRSARGKRLIEAKPDGRLVYQDLKTGRITQVMEDGIREPVKEMAQ